MARARAATARPTVVGAEERAEAEDVRQQSRASRRSPWAPISERRSSPRSSPSPPSPSSRCSCCWRHRRSGAACSVHSSRRAGRPWRTSPTGSRDQVTSYVLGTIAMSALFGLVILVTMTILGVPFALLIGLWVALVAMIPLVGGLIAAVPSVALALLHSPAAGVVTLVVFIGFQLIENHFIYPVVMSRTGADEPALGAARRTRRRQPRRCVRLFAGCPGRRARGDPGGWCDPGDLPRGVGPDPCDGDPHPIRQWPQPRLRLRLRASGSAVPVVADNGLEWAGPVRSVPTEGRRPSGGRQPAVDAARWPDDRRQARSDAAAGGVVPYAATMKVLVVLPTYNESENIEHVLRRIRDAVPAATVLVVDDGSPGRHRRHRGDHRRRSSATSRSSAARRSPGSAVPTGPGFRWGHRPRVRGLRRDGRRPLARARGAPGSARTALATATIW